MMQEERQSQLVAEAERFAEEKIGPRAREFDEAEVLADDLIQEMATRGYLTANLPREYGGLGLDPVHYGLFQQAIGKADCATRTLITVHSALCGESLLRWGNEEQKELWLPRMAKGETLAAFALSEPNVGTDAKSVETRYRKVGDTYVLNGNKKWISFGDKADLFVVIAGNDQGQKGQISAFLVQRDFPGVTTKPLKGMLAGRATHIAMIEFNNVEVPAANLIGKEGGGFTYVVSTALDHGRYSIAWAGVSIAQEAVEQMVSYARERKQFGKRLVEFQLIKGLIADATTETHAARALCLKAGEMRMNKAQDAVIETTMAKYFASKVAMKVATDCVQVHGGNGCFSDYPAERLFREAKMLEIIEGTSQIQQEIISGFALRKYNKACKR
ncbi:acyl-CoA dehydrogenase family protein [Paenibacillus sanguinis]|uniref:acyl-CoA dehydrogenase family protein n=1 Tax=Paenibacillus sanguinis TaxID=225906 RepID=UPI00036FB500|nr:acyl-CoA dehydrogenase family protein [Paenibacillus sanguinis]